MKNVLELLAHAPATIPALAVLTRQDESTVWQELHGSLRWWGLAYEVTNPRTPHLWFITDQGRGRLASNGNRRRDGACEGVRT